MPNDSSTGGYLVPTSADPLQDAALDALLQGLVVGVTGLDGTLVRPRWQSPANPGAIKQPEPSVNWCAIGVQSIESIDYPVDEHVPDGDGSDILTRWETLNALASFYGPLSSGIARRFRDGCYVAQNREAMQADGIDVYEVGTITAAPALINQLWRKRYDVPMKLRARIDRTFPILNLLSAPTTLVTN